MIRQTHKNHDIHFNEKSEQWICDSLGLANKSLKSIRSAIDRADKKQRTLALPALYLRESYWDTAVELLECVIVLLRTGNHSTANIRIKGDDEVEQVRLEELYPLSQRENLDAYVAAQKKAIDARLNADGLKEELEFFTPELVREAVAQQADAEPAL